MDVKIKEECRRAIINDPNAIDFFQANVYDGVFYYHNSEECGFWMNDNLLFSLGYEDLTAKQLEQLELNQFIVDEDCCELNAQSVHGADQIEINTIRFKTRDGQIIDGTIRSYFLHHLHQTYTIFIVALVGSKSKGELIKDRLIRDYNDVKSLNNWYFKNFPIAFQILDSNGKILEINSEWTKILGYTQDEVVGRLLSDYFIENEQQSFLHNYRKFAEKSFEHNVHNKMVAKDGRVLHVVFVGNVTQNFSDENWSTCCYFVERESLLEAKDHIIEGGDLFNNLFLEANIGIIIINDLHRIIKVNRYISQLLGYTREELINRPILELVAQHDQQVSLKMMAKLRTHAVESYIVRKNYLHKKGHVIQTQLAVNPVYTSGGDLNCLIGFITDMTKQNKIEDQLNTNLARYRKAQKLGKVGNWEYDFAKDFMWGSEEAKSIFGFPDDMTGDLRLCVKACIQEKDLIENSDFLNVLETKTKDISYTIKSYDTGEIKHVQSVSELEFDDDGKPIRISGVIRDITELQSREEKILLQNEALENLNQELLETNKKLEISKEKAEASNRLKTEFLNNMSHEIRTPMNGIMGFSNFMLKKELSKEKRLYYAKIIQSNSTQLLQVIDDILEISNLETKQVTVNEDHFSLNELIMEYYVLFAQEAKSKGIDFITHKPLSDDRSEIITDRTKLCKVISNLLENALKFTNEGHIELGYQYQDGMLQIYIKDTGKGIPEDKHTFIFDRFTQESSTISDTFGGLGLGLSISKENAQLLGGDIHLESVVDKGSVFTLSIPYCSSYEIVPFDEINKEQKEHTILIAEDEEVNYYYLEVLFEDLIKHNVQLIRATNGKEAIEYCLASSLKIDLVLMDIKMPIIDGLEATKRILESIPDLPIIALTAYSSEADRLRSLEAGFVDFISKPIDENLLFAKVDKYLKLDVVESI